MPATTNPDQFGDPTLSAAEAASACGPAAAVAFARANGRNPTLREALDLAQGVGWTADGGMNGVVNQQRLLERMGIPAELDAGATAATIGARARSGQMVTVSTPAHYYVVDGYDPKTGRVHVGQSGLARRGGAEWMTLEDIADRDGGINGALYQTVSDTGRGGAAPQEADMTAQEILRKLEDAKGKPTIRPVNPEREVETETDELNFLGQPTGKKIKSKSKGPNPEPTYRYLYPDGTYVDIAATSGNPDNIVGGTALTTLARADARAEAAAAKPPAAPKAPVTVNGTKYIWDAEAETFVPAPGLPTQDAKPPVTGAKPGRTFVVGRSIYRENEDGTVVKVGEEPRDAPQPAQRAPRYPDEIAQSEASAAASRASAASSLASAGRTTALLPGEIAQSDLALAAARKKMLPEQQQIFQAHQDTVKYVQGMLERGEIEQGQADAYIKLSRDAAESGLRGSTPFNEMKEKREAEQAQKRMGVDLLNQRLSSGQGLASSLLSSASSLAGQAMLRPGQTSLGVDPLAQLMPLLAQLQGGEDVTPFAKGMLMGGQPGGQVGAPMGVPPQRTPLPAGL